MKKSKRIHFIKVVVGILLFLTALDLLVGHYHLIMIPKFNTWRSEYAFSQNNIDYYYGDTYGGILSYGLYFTSLEKEIKSKHIRYDDLIKKSVPVNKKSWGVDSYYITSFAKIISCGKSNDRTKVVILPITAKFDTKYCSPAFNK